MGEYFGVSIDVEVIDAEGRSVACIKNVDGREADVYRSLISPHNEKREWGEQLRLDLLPKSKDELGKSSAEAKTDKWKDFHLRFSIFKVEEWLNGSRLNSRKRRFGFSFLPLFTSGSIVNDETHQLFVFQQDGPEKKSIPDPEEYLQKEFIYDAQMPNAAMKKQKGTNFNPLPDSFLDVKTRISSTMITEDRKATSL